MSQFKLDRTEDRGRAVQLVKDAARHVRKQGAVQACRDLNERDPRFVRGKFYVFALGMDGRRLAYPPDPGVVGQDGSVALDADGKPFGRELIRIAEAQGAGWCDFKFLNPETGRVEPKSVYVERVDDLILGCGIYTQASEPLGGPSATSPAWPRLAVSA